MEYGSEYQDIRSLVGFNRHVESSRNKPSWSDRFRKLRSLAVSISEALRNSAKSPAESGDVPSRLRHV